MVLLVEVTAFNQLTEGFEFQQQGYSYGYKQPMH